MASSTPDTRPEIVFGGGLIGGPKIPTASDVKTWTDLFKSHGHTRIDTAAAYPVQEMGQSEHLLAASGATSWATIDTKVLSFGAEKLHSREKVLKSIEGSLRNLGFDVEGGGKRQVDILYLHAPCLDTPLKETAGAVNEAYKRGWFRRFGVSNYTPWHVQELCDVAETKGWVKPSVYQGQYNPVTRTGEKDLFPVLRKNGISFFAYTPTGAGLFSGTVGADSVNREDGRFSKSNWVGQFFGSIYLRPELLAGADKVHKKAMEHGFNGHEAALRWCLHHSALKKELGDGVIVGASKIEQMKANLEACDHGPLPQDVVEVFEEVWKLAEPVAPYAYMENMGEAVAAQMEKK